MERHPQGLEGEMEHGLQFPGVNVAHNHPILTGKIIPAHLKEMPDYYRSLEVAELEGELFKVSGKGDAEKMVRKYKKLIQAGAVLSECENFAGQDKILVD